MIQDDRHQWPLEDMVLSRPLQPKLWETHARPSPEDLTDPTVQSLTEKVTQALRKIESAWPFPRANALRFFSEELLDIIESLDGITYEVDDSGIMLLFIAEQMIGYIPNDGCFGYSATFWSDGGSRWVMKISFVKTDTDWKIIDPKTILATAPIGAQEYILSLDTALDGNMRDSHFVPPNDPNWTDTTPEKPYTDS